MGKRRRSRNVSGADGKSAEAFQELTRILEVAVESGAESLEFEWEDGSLAVYLMKGGTGVGGHPFPDELETAVVEELVRRAGLNRNNKGNMRLTLLGQEYEVLVEERDSFGESAFTLQLRKT